MTLGIHRLHAGAAGDESMGERWLIQEMDSKSMGLCFGLSSFRDFRFNLVLTSLGLDVASLLLGFCFASASLWSLRFSCASASSVAWGLGWQRMRN